VKKRHFFEEIVPCEGTIMAGDVPALASHVRQQEEEERRYAQERSHRKRLECEASTPDAGDHAISSHFMPFSKTPEIMPAVQISAIAQHLLSTGYTPAKLANSAEFSPRQGPSLMEVIGVRQPTPKPPAPPPPPPPAMRMPILDLSVVVDDAILSEAMQAPNQTLWSRLHAEGAVESARLRALWDEECRHREVTNTRADASPPWYARPHASASRTAIRSKPPPAAKLGSYAVASVSAGGNGGSSSCAAGTAAAAAVAAAVEAAAAVASARAAAAAVAEAERPLPKTWRNAGPTGNFRGSVLSLDTMLHARPDAPSPARRRLVRSASFDASYRAHSSTFRASSVHASPRPSPGSSPFASPARERPVDTAASSYQPDSFAALLSLLGVDRPSIEALERAGVTSLDAAVKLGTADLAAMGLRLLTRDRVLRAVGKARSYAVRQAAMSSGGEPPAASRIAPWSAGMERQRLKPSLDAEGRRLTRWRGLVCGWSATDSSVASLEPTPRSPAPSLAKADEAVTGDEALTGADRQAEAVEDGMRVDSVFCPISACASPHFFRPNQT
jgi:hypothetical protein